MTSFLAQCLQFALLAPLALAAPTSRIAKRVLTPSTDPFYQPPSGFESQSPGAILNTRTITSSLFGDVPTGVETYQLLFRTTAINGSAIAGVTSVFVPQNASQNQFISFQTAYDGSSTLCDPSYTYQLDSEQLDLISEFETLLLEAYLVGGYIVSAPDYEGPDAAFGAGPLEGMVVLDSMRAVSNFQDTLGFTSSPQIVGYGYSGGGLGTGWAASLQSSYAPELDILGWAQGGTPANLTGTADYLDDTLFSGFLLAALNGLNQPSSYAAQLTPVYDSVLTDYGAGLLDFASDHCIGDLFIFPEQSVLSTNVQSLGDGFFYQSDVASVLSQLTMGVQSGETPTSPVYIYHASQDEVIPYADVETLVNNWCGYGANLNFVTFASGGHLTTEILGFVGAYQFVESAFAGTVDYSGCSSSTTYNNTLSPLDLGLDLEPILSKLINFLSELGQGDSNVISNPGTLNNTSSS